MGKMAKKAGKDLPPMLDISSNGASESSPSGVVPPDAGSPTPEASGPPSAEVKGFVKAHCKANRLKLWEPPYYDNGYQESAISELAQKIADDNAVSDIQTVVTEIKAMIDFTNEKMAVGAFIYDARSPYAASRLTKLFKFHNRCIACRRKRRHQPG